MTFNDQRSIELEVLGFRHIAVKEPGRNDL